jgi:pyruvate-ferredoxin/flavodoxin oxidoreductase
MALRANPEHAERLVALAQKDIDDQWHYYEQMAGVERQMTIKNGEVAACPPN